ncbi:MAG: hypothetical protein QUS14_09900 [Pyrinomonadaceae bacterium]|nr:hypothetical protein [Pyrinomonadaceae bacterium]
MPNYGSPLNNIKVASACSADWESMYGNDRMRYCGQCKLNVYNLSGMTRSEAESLIERAEGRLCVRYYQRADGTVITKDCPVGWALVKKKASVFATGAFAIFVSAFSGGFFASAFNREKAEVVVGAIPIANTNVKRDEMPPVSVMGNIAVPPADKKEVTPTKPKTVGVVTLKPVDHDKDREEMVVRTKSSAGA